MSTKNNPEPRLLLVNELELYKKYKCSINGLILFINKRDYKFTTAMYYTGEEYKTVRVYDNMLMEIEE